MRRARPRPPRRTRAIPTSATVGAAATLYDSWRFEQGNCRQALLDHLRVTTLAGYGCEELPLAVRAAGVLVQYLREHSGHALAQLNSLSTYSTRRVHDAGYRHAPQPRTDRDDPRPQPQRLAALGARSDAHPDGRASAAHSGSRSRCSIAALSRSGCPRWRPVCRVPPVAPRCASYCTGMGDLTRSPIASSRASPRPRDLLAPARPPSNASADLRSALVALVCAKPDGGRPSEPYPLDGDSLDALRGGSPRGSREAIVDDPPATLSGGRRHPPRLFAETGRHRASVAEAKRWVANLEARRARAHGHQEPQGRL